MRHAVRVQCGLGTAVQYLDAITLHNPLNAHVRIVRVSVDTHDQFRHLVCLQVPRPVQVEEVEGESGGVACVRFRGVG
jgi:hypothetical protein